MEFTWKKTPDVVYKVKVGELGELLMAPPSVYTFDLVFPIAIVNDTSDEIFQVIRKKLIINTHNQDLVPNFNKR
ncbi:3440_t:CDS:2 [Entrophospora sp. SA101]|nr:3440_t:CDS:2 [Entrophospora sp. SA101]